jgi:phytoene dehydrogenase-like protein
MSGQLPAYDAVIGSGPNGLAAAITLARAGCSVLVIEARETIGGGTRSAELTLPGFVHDICATIFSSQCSPFFRELPLAEYGLEWVHPPAAVAHPLDDGTVVFQEQSVEATSQGLGKDAAAYRRLMSPLVKNWEAFFEDVLGPLRIPPRHPVLLGRFGLSALRSAKGLANSLFREDNARALFTGLAGHSIQPLERQPTAAFGLMLSLMAYATGWPVARGGSQNVANALGVSTVAGEIATGIETWRNFRKPVRSVRRHAALR